MWEWTSAATLRDDQWTAIEALVVHRRRALVVQRTGIDVEWDDERDVWWHDVVDSASDEHEAQPHDSEHPLFILYTSGSTGKPKGVLHTTGGYLLWAGFTHELVFDYRPGNVFWCAADIGWVTGHTYIVYGPLANGATTLMYEGLPNWPDASRIWQVVDRHQVHTLFTAPTAPHALTPGRRAPSRCPYAPCRGRFAASPGRPPSRSRLNDSRPPRPR